MFLNINKSCINFLVLLAVTHAFQFSGDSCTSLDSNFRHGICMQRNDCYEYYARKKLVMNGRLHYCENGGIMDNLICCPVTHAKQGDSCIIQDHPNDISGECSVIEECENAKSLLQKIEEKNLETIRHTCYLNDSLVCCPLQKFRSAKTIADEKCLEYGHHRDRYGVTNGKMALPEEFPHMAAVGLRDDNNELVWFCGGSLISENFVLTAAHCTRYEGQAPTLVGLGNIALDDLDNKFPPEEFGISKIYRHPNYKFSSHYHDIALLKLKCKIDIHGFDPKSIFPACLHTEKEIPAQLEAIGWGLTERYEKSNYLLKVTLNVSDHRNCAALFTNVLTRRLRNNIDDELQICAGGSGYDTCEGDSGGPLHYSVPQNVLTGDAHRVIAGITSFGKGKGCGLIGVYTRVSAYIPWIESIVWPSNDTSLDSLEEPFCQKNRPFFMFEGDRCLLHGDWYFSVCTNIHNCGIAYQLFERGLQLPICGFNGRHYLVCCLPKNIKCHNYK